MKIKKKEERYKIDGKKYTVISRVIDNPNNIAEQEIEFEQNKSDKYKLYFYNSLNLKNIRKFITKSQY